MFEYIDDNLKKVINSSNILYFKTCSIENKWALCAVISNEKGVYERVILTKPQNYMTYPFEPVYKFFNGPGYFIKNDFIPLMYNQVSINRNFLNWIEYVEEDLNKNKLIVFARFKDGSCTTLDFVSKKRFEKHEREKYRKILNYNKITKENIPENIGNPIIEFFMNGDVAVIPSLQNEKEKTYVKKLD